MISSLVHRRALFWAVYWGIPPLLALALYWPALHAWFQADDFAYLSLLGGIHTRGDLWRALFHPTGHGTWRPVSERTYFLSLEALFGYDTALPFRMVAFLVQFANMALISAVTFRLTRSRLAGFLAPVLWIASDKLALSMTWSSAFIYVSGGFFILSAQWLFLRHIETGRTRYLAATWAAFLLGLGALEVVIVFPLMAMIYTWACARPYFRKTIPLGAAAAVFAVMRMLLVPKPAAASYQMHFDGTILGTLAAYVGMALKPVNLSDLTTLPESAGTVAMILFAIALAGYLGLQAMRRNWIPWVFLSWFFAALLPALPLRDHVNDYYLSLPLIGMAMLAADAFAHAWQSGAAWRGAALVLVAFFLFESGLTAYRASWWYANRSRQIRSMMMGVREAHRAHPERAILLKDIDDALFWAGVQARCFRLLGVDNVYLAPGSDSYISAHPEIDQVSRFIMPAATAGVAFGRGRLSVYAWDGNRLNDITGRYVPGESQPFDADSATIDRIDVADPTMADRLSKSWYRIDQGFRWMPKRASVRINAATAGKELRISGHCPAVLLQKGPLHLTVSVNGVPFAPVNIENGDAPFAFAFRLPPGLPKEIEVGLEVDRTFRMPVDLRDLGLIFGVIQVR